MYSRPLENGHFISKFKKENFQLLIKVILFFKTDSFLKKKQLQFYFIALAQQIQDVKKNFSNLI